jgi:acyl carrier protein
MSLMTDSLAPCEAPADGAVHDVANLETHRTVDLIRATWAELLGLREVLPDDDFFELGGHSLMAASAVARLGERLALELPPLALFEAPTAAEMAELVAEVREGRRPEDAGSVVPHHPAWVVPLQREGTGRPVFVFPAGHDDVSVLTVEAWMATHVGRDHPFWGFAREDPDLAEARAAGIPGLAAAYAARMRAIQGRGPFLLYANCAGGAYAWETASQLLDAGESIAGMLFYVVPLEARNIAPPRVFTPAQPTTPSNSSRAYRPHPLPVDLTLVMTEFWRDRRWSDAWRQVALGTVETVVISEEEERRSRREERLARHVRNWIEAAEARVRRLHLASSPV